MHQVSSRVGGLLTLSGPGQLLCNEQQMKYATKLSTQYNPADELYSVMFKAKQEDVRNLFI